MVAKYPVVNIVHQFAEAVRNQGVPLKEVYLFGSYARGEQHDLSDIDVALVSDDFMGVSFEDVKRFIDVTIQKPYMYFEIHTYNTADFEDTNPLAHEIIKTGIKVI